MSALNALFLLTHMSAFTLKCSIYDTPCLASSAQNYATVVIPGGTGFGFQVMDPMSMDPIKGEQDGLIYSLSGVEVVGLKNSLIEKVQFNKKDKRAYLKLRIPCLTIFANYSMDGKAPFEGEGKSIFNLYDLENELTMNYDIIKGKNGKDYIKFDNYLYWFDVRYVESSFENTNNDVPTKAIELEELLKKEFRRIWQQYGRNFLDKFNDRIFEMLKRVLLLQPADNILSDY